MSRRTLAAVGWPLILGLLYLAPAWGDERTAAAEPLEVASVRFEQNATDGDVEVVFEITGSDEGLTRLTVVAPDGRTVVDFTAPAAAKYGIRQFVFESPEPTDVASLKAAYPAGEYIFGGADANGDEFRGTASLSHELPQTVAALYPAPRATGVAVKNLEITWKPVKGAAGYVLELEQARLNMKLIVNLPASAAKFAVPAGLLVAGTKYQLGIGTVATSGNVSFIETSFTTK